MKIYINSRTDPYFNLAAEEYLLEHSSDDIFMLWRNSPAVIIGKNQNAYAEINFGFTNSHDIKIVRRLTGGGAVFHDLGNVNFTFISPAGGELAKGIRRGGLDFAYFTQPVADALASLGIKAELSGRNDILAETPNGGANERRKISGNAQCVYNCADGSVKTLHHGTLLFSADLTKMQGALNVDPEKLKSKGIKSVRSRVANISELIPTEKKHLAPDAERFLHWLAEAVSARFETSVCYFDENITSGIEMLSREKYSQDQWNLRRFGSFQAEFHQRFGFGAVEIGIDVLNGKISEMKIGGDFFGVRDAAELADTLRGTEYTFAAVSCKLARCNVGDYISGADADIIARLICGGN